MKKNLNHAFPVANKQKTVFLVLADTKAFILHLQKIKR
jgi:hypothetical protein